MPLKETEIIDGFLLNIRENEYFEDLIPLLDEMFPTKFILSSNKILSYLIKNGFIITSDLKDYKYKLTQKSKDIILAGGYEEYKKIQQARIKSDKRNYILSKWTFITFWIIFAFSVISFFYNTKGFVEKIKIEDPKQTQKMNLLKVQLDSIIIENKFIKSELTKKNLLLDSLNNKIK